MTTPESQQVQKDRKSSFLDNIGERARQAEEQRREAQRKRGREGGRGGKTLKSRKAPIIDKKVCYISQP